MLPGSLGYFKLIVSEATLFLGKSHARHRYQLATDRKGAQRNPLLNTTSGLGKSSAESARDLGTRWNVSA
jgi:hypothetical protein